MPTALITGASRGFGRELAAELARRDWSLVLDARTGSDLSSTGVYLSELGTGTVYAVPGDVTDIHHLVEVVEAATRHGDFRLLVNNASTLGARPLPALSTYPPDSLRHVFEVNLIAPLRLVQTALPHLRDSRGTIVNITSDAAVEGYEGWGGYGSSKAALEQLSNVLAAEQPDVKVYWFDPGDMQTRMQQEAFPGEDISDRPLPETRVPPLMQLIESDAPSGRYSATEMLAGVLP